MVTMGWVAAVLITAQSTTPSESAPPAPSEAAPPAAATGEPVTEPPPPPAKPALPPADAAPKGQSDMVTGLAQFGTGLCIEAVFCGLGYVPVVGCCSSCANCLVGPAIIGGGEVAVGDMIGTKRSGMLWPIVGAYAGRLVMFGVSLGVSLVVFGAAYAALVAAIQSGDASQISAAQASLVAAQLVSWPVTIGLSLVSAAVVAAVPAGIYMLTAEDKKPGDDGSFQLGIMAPAHPSPKPAPKKAARPKAAASRTRKVTAKKR